MTPLRALLLAVPALLALALAPDAQAGKKCELDLQIIFLNADQVAKSDATVKALDTLSFGLFSTTFGEELTARVYEEARKETELALAENKLTGSARVLPARLSGRPKGWIYWDPTTDQLTERPGGVETLGDVNMLVVHLDDPEAAAIEAGGKSATTVGLGKLLGADIRGRVYDVIVFEKMKPTLVEYKLTTLVNTGFGVKCKDVVQGY